MIDLVRFLLVSFPVLWSAGERVEQAELVEIIEGINLQEYEGLIAITPTKNFSQDSNRPKHHGNRWTLDELEQLEIMLKKDCIIVDDIAFQLGRSTRSFIRNVKAGKP